MSTPDIEVVRKPLLGWVGVDGKPIRAVGDNCQVALSCIPVPRFGLPEGPAVQDIPWTWLEFAIWKPSVIQHMWVPPR